MRDFYAASERIPANEDSDDARAFAVLVTATRAHVGAGRPAVCQHVIRTLTDEEGVTIQTCCEPRS